MLMGMLYLYLSDSISQDPESRVYYIISAWASALLVTDKMGDARASYRGTSNKFRLPRFFLYLFQFIQSLVQGVSRYSNFIQPYSYEPNELLEIAMLLWLYRICKCQLLGNRRIS